MEFWVGILGSPYLSQRAFAEPLGPGFDLHTATGAPLSNQFHVSQAIIVTKESELPTITTLSYVCGTPGATTRANPAVL
ncbi:MAG TPA: hypothetical protein VMC85_10340 [Desulfomonilaceae bacterium]|nr:hypothetical protein [Desulfomonilaceae bacterium]